MERVRKIYALADPASGEVRYVGITLKTPRIRCSEIKSRYKEGRFKEVGEWLLSLTGYPTSIILESNPPDGMDGEKRWIALFRVTGARLLNKSDGGQGSNGVFPTLEVRKKISEAIRGKRMPGNAARNQSRRVLTPDKVLEIRALIDSGTMMKDIAAKYSVSPALISLIKAGQRYAT